MESTFKSPLQLDPSKAERLLQSLFAVADIVNIRKMGFLKKTDSLLRVVLDHLGAEQGSLMVLKGKKLEVLAATRKELVGVKQKLSEPTVAAWVVRNRQPLFIADISKDDRFAQRKGMYKKDSLLSAPVIHQGRVIGVINAADKSGSKDLLKDDVAPLLHLSSFILWTFLQQDLHTKITKQRNTLRARNEELRRQEAMRNQLSRLLIHDLKAPLSEVVANLDILSYSVSGEEKEFLEAAQMGCDRAVRMVGNLVTSDKIAEGRQQLMYEESDCLGLLKEALSGVRGLACIKNIDILRQSPDESVLLTVDRTLILRVLQNLLTNAISYSDTGSTITTGFDVVEERGVEFYVQDEGPGIPPEQQETIFDKYARVSSKQDTLVGAGLGLYFCKLAIELHGGTIAVSSQEGGGSRFSFLLPLA